MRLFICSDKADEILLETLTDMLDGYRMTIDIDRMVGTRDSRPALQAAIQDCDAFVFAVTNNSLRSSRCLWEYSQAVDNKRPIVIALLQTLDPFPPKFEEHLIADLRNEEGKEQLLDALYVVGATPPSVLTQLFRNRILLYIVILVGFLVAWLLVGPYSPFRETVTGTLTEIIAVADRTVDLSRPIPTVDPNDPALAPIRAMTLSANADSIFRSGQELARNGNYEGAIDAYNRTLEIAPGSIGAHIARGNAFHAIGATDTAWGDYTRAIELAPNLALPYISRAAFYVDVNQPDGALIDIETALSIEPDNAQAYNLRGEAYFQRGEYEAALNALNYALQLQPEYAEAFNNRGEVYRFQGRPKLAQADFDRAIALNPLLSEAYTRRGLLLQSQNNAPAALRDFTRAVELNPDDGEARYGRALIYSAQGDYPLAASDFSRAIAQKPDDPNLYLLRGSTYRCTNEPALAVADFTSAAQLDLDATVAYLRRQVAYICDNQSIPELSPSRIGATDPTIEGAYLYIADQLEQRANQRESGGDIQGAENDYGLAIIMSPSYTEVADLYYQRGQMFERQSDFDRALADYQTAAEILPERGQYRIDIGRMFARQGDNEEALKQYAQALELNPISIPAYLARGDLYRADGDLDQALDNYTRASFIDKDNVDALTRRVQVLVEQEACKLAEVDMNILRNTSPDDPAVMTTDALFNAGCATEEASTDGTT